VLKKSKIQATRVRVTEFRGGWGDERALGQSRESQLRSHDVRDKWNCNLVQSIALIGEVDIPEKPGHNLFFLLLARPSAITPHVHPQVERFNTI